MSLFIAVFLPSILLRWKALHTELWLDEIWSLELARHVHSVFDIFTLRHDNNNPLNTLYLYLIYPQHRWIAYRLLSFAAGLATIVLLGRPRSREDRPAAFFRALLSGFSILMILYATEARGYACAAFFAVACYELVDDGARATVRRAVLFVCCAILGALSHGTFLYFFAALTLWQGTVLIRQRRMPDFFKFFLAPWLSIALFCIVQMRGLVIGEAYQRPFGSVLFRTLALFAGAPDQGPWAWFGIVLLLGIVALAFWKLPPERSFFFAILFPIALASVALFPYPYERHFFICLPFILMIAAEPLAAVYRRYSWGKYPVALLIGLFLWGNGLWTNRLIQDGRGHYLEAMQFMAGNTTAREITLGSDHDFRNSLVIDFYKQYMTPAKPVRYIDKSHFADDPPEWFLLHSFDTDLRGAWPILDLIPNLRYHLWGSYPYGGLSGWTWLLYHRDLLSSKESSS